MFDSTSKLPFSQTKCGIINTMTPQESFPEPERRTHAQWDTTEREELKEIPSAFAHIARNRITSIRGGLRRLELAREKNNQERVEQWLNRIEEDQITAEQELEGLAQTLEQKPKPQSITPEEIRELAERIKNININDPEAQSTAAQIELHINELVEKKAA